MSLRKPNVARTRETHSNSTEHKAQQKVATMLHEYAYYAIKLSKLSVFSSAMKFCLRIISNHTSVMSTVLKGYSKQGAITLTNLLNSHGTFIQRDI